MSQVDSLYTLRVPGENNLQTQRKIFRDSPDIIPAIWWLLTVEHSPNPVKDYCTRPHHPGRSLEGQWHLLSQGNQSWWSFKWSGRGEAGVLDPLSMLHQHSNTLGNGNVLHWSTADLEGRPRGVLHPTSCLHQCRICVVPHKSYPTAFYRSTNTAPTARLLLSVVSLPFSNSGHSLSPIGS